jgi:protein-tyrosine phosphatase
MNLPITSPKGGYGHNKDLWSEILPGLWMGGTGDDSVLTSFQVQPEITNLHFDTVVTLYASALPVDWYVKELRLGFFDHDKVDIDAHDLDQVVQSAHADWQAGKRVLIRCQAGWNRSGLVTALVLMREGYRSFEAIELIRQMRSESALCNRSFEQFLRDKDTSDVDIH